MIAVDKPNGNAGVQQRANLVLERSLRFDVTKKDYRFLDFAFGVGLLDRWQDVAKSSMYIAKEIDHVLLSHTYVVLVTVNSWPMLAANMPYQGNLHFGLRASLVSNYFTLSEV